jgi:hypothetical protein
MNNHFLTSVDEGISNKLRPGALDWHELLIGFQENPTVSFFFKKNCSDFTHKSNLWTTILT